MVAAASIDRVHDSTCAAAALGWEPVRHVADLIDPAAPSADDDGDDRFS